MMRCDFFLRIGNPIQRNDTKNKPTISHPRTQDLRYTIFIVSNFTAVQISQIDPDRIYGKIYSPFMNYSSHLEAYI
jgi:hypothetical protein